MTQAPSEPAISLAITTGRGWPMIERYVRALELAAEMADGEVVVVDGSGREPPTDGSLHPRTRWLSCPRSSVFALRPLMLAACRGPIIGLTEDHCLVAPGWALALLHAHRQYPDALAIGGAVDNSAADTAVDWASYFVVQVTSLPPVVPSRRPRLAHANVSYKRAALELMTIDEDMGGLDALDQIDLGNQNGALRIDPRPIVRHDQSHSLREFVGQHFHAGRTFGGFVRHRGGRRYALRLAILPALPTLRLLRSARAGARSYHRRHLRRALPQMAALIASQTVGQAVGLLVGAGDSPLYVEG